jgi:hypothetical protein
LDEKGGELKLTVAYYYLPSGKCVHRLKDAKDWGVDPQIVVPMDPAAEEQLMKDHYEQELFHRPMAKVTTASSTAPATAEAATAPTSQPSLDVQLQRAVDTMIALVVLQGEKVADAPAPTVVPPIAMTVSPATAPTTEPTTTP